MTEENRMPDPFAQYRLIFRKYRDFTMIPEDRYVANLMVAAMHAHIAGCVVECGTWRGGMVAGLADVLGSGRTYYLFDSFEGLPPAQEIDGPDALAWQADVNGSEYYDNCRAELSSARHAMSMSAAKDVRIIKGWFDETLKGFAAPEKIAVLRLDGDWYASTITCLEYLFPQLAANGVVIVDDYYDYDGCARAVHDYLSRNNLAARIIQPAGIAAIKISR